MYFLLNTFQFLIKTAYKSNTKQETGNGWVTIAFQLMFLLNL